MTDFVLIYQTMIMITNFKNVPNLNRNNPQNFQNITSQGRQEILTSLAVFTTYSHNIFQRENASTSSYWFIANTKVHWECAEALLSVIYIHVVLR